MAPAVQGRRLLDVAVLLILILIVLAVAFGGFQKGTKAAGLGPFHDRGQFGANSAQDWP